jgi:hypothetical protein
VLGARASGGVHPPASWQRFRFGSGLLRMGDAWLEQATSCL